MNPQELVQLQQLLAGFLSHESTVQTAAERAINTAFDSTTNREKFVTGLMQVLRTCTTEEHRSLAAVLLRKKLPNGEPIYFEKLSDTVKELVKTELLKALTLETQRYVLTQISDTIADLAECLLFKNEWSQLVPFLFKCVNEASDNVKISALSIFGKLFDSQYDVLETQLSAIRELYAKCLKSSNLMLRSEAAFVTCRTVNNVDDNKEMKAFHPFVPPILQTLSDLYMAKESNASLRVLSALVEVATEASNFFRPHLEAVSKAMAIVGQSKDFEDGFRQLAMELLVAVCEDNPPAARKNGTILTASVSLAFNLMLTIADDPTWTQEEETPDLFDGSNCDCGEIAIDRLSQAIGGKKFIPIVFPLISEFLKRDDWKFRHTALKALSQAGEVAEFEQIPFKDVAVFVKDKHPRVRYAAINCLGQLSNDFQPLVQQKLHKLLIPCLTEPLGDSEHPRIQTHAASALCNFLVHCNAERDGDIVGPYVDTLMSILTKLLQTSTTKRIVQEQLMTTIAAVAGASPQRFKKYYARIVPLIKQVIVGANKKEHMTLRSRAMECVTFIGMAVGADMFKKDAREIMTLFLGIMQKGQAPDDTNMQYMLQAWTRICTVIGKEFVPCLPFVIPWVFAQAKKQVDMSLIERDPDKDVHTPDALRGETRIFTSALEDKATACSMICSFVHDLQDAFFPYLKEAAQIMIPLMSYYLNDDVRQYAISVTPDFLSCAMGAYDNKKTDLDTVRGLFKEISSYMIKSFPAEPSTELLQTMVGSLQMCVGVVGNIAKECLDKTQLLEIGQALLKLLKQSHERIHSREEKKKNEDIDEEALLNIMEQNASEDELNFLVSECIGALIQSHKEEFLPVFDTVLPEINRLLDSKSPPSTRKIAVYIVDDIIEHLGIASTPYFKHFIPAFLAYCNDENVELRQASAYGLAMAAEKGRHHFQPYVDEALKRLSIGLQAKGARSEDNASATDNMISALLRIAVFQNRPQMIVPFLQSLPILADEEEANFVYDQVCGLVEKNNPAMLGKDYSNLPRIISVFVEVLSTDPLKKMLEESLAGRMLAILQKLRTLPPESAQKITTSITPKHLQALQELIGPSVGSTTGSTESTTSSSTTTMSTEAEGGKKGKGKGKGKAKGKS